jgi:hypothetical protein
MAGRTWLKGASPYDTAKWATEWSVIQPSPWANGHPPPGPYVYPPHWAIIAVPLALLPWHLAARIWDALNVSALLGTCSLLWRFAAQRDRKLSTPMLIGFTAIAGLNGAVRWCLIEGQMSLVPTFALVGAFWAYGSGRRHWLALFTFVAALKPQISFLPLLFIALNGGLPGVLEGGLGILITSLVAMARSGLTKVPEQVLSAYRLHLQLDFNGASQFFNVSALLSAIHVGRHPLLLGPILGVVAVLALMRANRRAELGDPLSDPFWQLGILSAIEVAFVPQHGYDMVMYTPVVFLACLFRPRWLAVPLVLLVALASRARDIGVHAHLAMTLAPLVCLAVVVTCIIAVKSAPVGTVISTTWRGRGRAVGAPLSPSPLQPADPARPGT